MKKLSFLLCFLILFNLCSCAGVNTTDESKTEYKRIDEINHYAVEADDSAYMSDSDHKLYKKLIDAMLSYKDSVRLSDDKKQNEYVFDLLRQSPYYFFAKDSELVDETVYFDYSYAKQEQSIMLDFMDEQLLSIINSEARATDNELDVILKIYAAVSRKIGYDHKREDNKQLGSPLFDYPDDEVYKALKTEKSLCFGFAYTLRFALLQVGVDCFCQYGQCTNRNQAHMWNIFEYNGQFYTCDSAWDRADDDFAKLFHFGKTDAERISDGLEVVADTINHEKAYGKVECTDKMFEVFRGIERYTYLSGHHYYMEDFAKGECEFDSELFVLK